MFQKMIQVDKQVREEMNEKFHNETKEMQQNWNEQHQIAMEQQRSQLEAKFSTNLAVSFLFYCSLIID
jgi:hypothetical protein